MIPLPSEMEGAHRHLHREENHHLASEDSRLSPGNHRHHASEDYHHMSRSAGSMSVVLTGKSFVVISECGGTTNRINASGSSVTVSRTWNDHEDNM